MTYINSGQVVAILQDIPFLTIRHVNCPVIHDKVTRCSECVSYRRKLLAIASKRPLHIDEIGFKTNHRHMTKPLMLKKIYQLQSKVKKQEKHIKELEEKIEKDYRSISLDENLHSSFLSIMHEHHQDILNNHPEGSFARIFWENQYKAASTKCSTQFRWNPAIVRWCIFLRHKSSKAYDLLRKTGILHLPLSVPLGIIRMHTKAQMGFLQN